MATLSFSVDMMVLSTFSRCQSRVRKPCILHFLSGEIGHGRDKRCDVTTLTPNDQSIRVGILDLLALAVSWPCCPFCNQRLCPEFGVCFRLWNCESGRWPGAYTYPSGRWFLIRWDAAATRDHGRRICPSICLRCYSHGRLKAG